MYYIFRNTMKNMKFNILLLFSAFLLLAVMPVTAQQKFHIVSFDESPLDMTARDAQHEKIDGNGDRFAIVKVTSTSADDDLRAYNFDFGYMESLVESKGSELWVYVQRNAKHVTITRSGYHAVSKYDLRTTIQPGCVYVMQLSPEAKRVLKQMVYFKVTPADSKAMVMYRKEQPGSTEEVLGTVDANGELAENLECGRYFYRVVSKEYHPSEGVLSLNGGDETLCESVILRPKYAVVTLNAEDGVAIYIDGELAGTGSFQGKLNSGKYNIECRKENYNPGLETIIVEEGKDMTLQLRPLVPVTGSLSLKSVPLGANITINGKDYGVTPRNISGLVIGKHKVELYKEEFGRVTVTVSIKKDEVAEYTVDLRENSIEQAKDAYNKEDYAKAFEIAQKLAMNGDAAAQNLVGFYYFNGKGVDQSYDEAVKWWRMAAEQGFAGAQRNLGICYADGNGVPQSFEEAVKLYRMAAEQGDGSAQNNLAICYVYGNGVPESLDEAIKWWQKSAKQGNAEAQGNLGRCYYNGEGVAQSYEEAVKWLSLAVEQGNSEAMVDLGTCYKNGKGVPKSYNEAVRLWRKADNRWAMDEIRTCYEEALGVDSLMVEGYKIDAEGSYLQPLMQSNLAYCYYYGIYVPQSYDEAVKWWRKAAENGGLRGMNELGVCYAKGYGVPQSYAEAVKWWRKAAEKDYGEALYNLALCYTSGDGISVQTPETSAEDDAEAFKLFSKAAEEDIPAAMFWLGQYHERGYVVSKSYEKALEWYKKASEEGYGDASACIGRMYLLGLGIPKSYEEAVKWFEKAVGQGSSIAMEGLALCYEKGYGVKKSKIKAEEWYAKAEKAEVEDYLSSYVKPEK